MKIREVFKKENQLWVHNAHEIEQINHNILILCLIIICVGSFLLSIASTFNESFSLLKLPYYGLFGITSLILWRATRENQNISSLVRLYIVHTLLMLFSAYGGAVVAPESPSTLILGFVFVFSLTVFDKISRVNFVMLMYLIFYVLFVTPFKAYDVIFMDLMNVIGFSSVAMALGGYLRHLQLENIELRRQSRLKETTDVVTGLENRTKLQEIMQDPQTLSNVCAVLMMDIDHFKAYNDTYGHQKGDECLKQVSAVLSTLTRKHKLSVYRYGGEEFLGIVWNDETATPHRICETIIHNIEALAIKHEKSDFHHVTTSLGYSVMKKTHPQTISQLIAQADQALYQSKHNGRNQLTQYEVEGL